MNQDFFIFGIVFIIILAFFWVYILWRKTDEGIFINLFKDIMNIQAEALVPDYSYAEEYESEKKIKAKEIKEIMNNLFFLNISITEKEKDALYILDIFFKYLWSSTCVVMRVETIYFSENIKKLIIEEAKEKAAHDIYDDLHKKRFSIKK